MERSAIKTTLDLHSKLAAQRARPSAAAAKADLREMLEEAADDVAPRDITNRLGVSADLLTNFSRMSKADRARVDAWRTRLLERYEETLPRDLWRTMADHADRILPTVDQARQAGGSELYRMAVRVRVCQELASPMTVWSVDLDTKGLADRSLRQKYFEDDPAMGALQERLKALDEVLRRRIEIVPGDVWPNVGEVRDAIMAFAREPAEAKERDGAGDDRAPTALGVANVETRRHNPAGSRVGFVDPQAIAAKLPGG